MLSFICLLCSLNIILCFNNKSNINTLPDYEIPSWVYKKVFKHNKLYKHQKIDTIPDYEIPSWVYKKVFKYNKLYKHQKIDTIKYEYKNVSNIEYDTILKLKLPFGINHY